MKFVMYFNEIPRDVGKFYPFHGISKHFLLSVGIIVKKYLYNPFNKPCFIKNNNFIFKDTEVPFPFQLIS